MNSSAYIPLIALTITQKEPLNFDPRKERVTLEYKSLFYRIRSYSWAAKRHVCRFLGMRNGERTKERTCWKESGTEREVQEAVNS